MHDFQWTYHALPVQEFVQIVALFHKGLEPPLDIAFPKLEGEKSDTPYHSYWKKKINSVEPEVTTSLCEPPKDPDLVNFLAILVAQLQIAA